MGTLECFFCQSDSIKVVFRRTSFTDLQESQREIQRKSSVLQIVPEVDPPAQGFSLRGPQRSLPSEYTGITGLTKSPWGQMVPVHQVVIWEMGK